MLEEVTYYYNLKNIIISIKKVEKISMKNNLRNNFNLSILK